MVAHARLVVIGGDSQRLHEEIITAGGQIREGRFSRFGSLKEVQDALAAATAEEPSEAVKRKLLDLWPKTAEPIHRPWKLAPGTGPRASRRCSPSGPRRRSPTSRRS